MCLCAFVTRHFKDVVKVTDFFKVQNDLFEVQRCFTLTKKKFKYTVKKLSVC